MELFIIFLFVVHASKLSTLIEEVEDFRKNLVEMPDDFFDMELDIRSLIDEDEGSELFNEFTSIRKRLVNIVEISDKLMDVELEINTLDEEPKHEDPACENWYLGMNLNPEDGHIMDYTTGWASSESIGTNSEALIKDYLNELVWRDPVNMIAIVRHQNGVADAVKVFNFTEHGLSMLQRFRDMDPGRIFASEGGPVQVMIAGDAENLSDDPIFSIGGDLVINWVWSDNGVRIALSGGYLSPLGHNDDNTHGLGVHYWCTPLKGTSIDPRGKNEISNIQYCPFPECVKTMVQGTDSGNPARFIPGPVYGNYAIYVSRDAETFPRPGSELDLVVKSC